MSINLKLGYGLAMIYGFTAAIWLQGAYYPRDRVLIPSREYCKRVLKRAGLT